MVLTLVEQSILYTLAYSAQFQFPLTVKEIQDRLIFRLSEKMPLLGQLEPAAIEQALPHLERMKLVKQCDGYYCLPGFAKTIKIRQQRADYSEVKALEVKDFLTSVNACPWIKAVFVTGSAAVKNAELEADLDFMIVTEPRRLWLTRLWVIWQAWRRGKRRSWQGEEKRSWCFNLWLESDQLHLFQDYQSLYTAYELIQAQPVLDRAQLAAQLLKDNLWAATYLPLAPVWKQTQMTETAHIVSSAPWSVWSILNTVAYHLQRWYMRRHMTRERVEPGVALFHPRDTETWILKRWRAVILKVGGQAAIG